MSVIAVGNVPMKVGLKDVVKILQKPIRGQFEALNFKKTKNSKLMKTCYLRLSERLDPVQVVQNINNFSFKGKGAMRAFIPDNVPDIPLGTSLKSKQNRVPASMRKMVRIAEENANGRIVDFTTDEIMSELQAKYPGIVALSAKYNHKLLQDIAKVIHERVSVLVSRSPELEESCFKSTRAYRRAHPHSEDFQLVLSSLHTIQDAAGTSQEQLQTTLNTILNDKSSQQGLEMPAELVRSYCQKYSKRIAKKMAVYLQDLDVVSHYLDTEEDKARKRIRTELKKLQPFLIKIVNEVVSTQCSSEDKKFHQIRIYGEPLLPGKEILMPFLARYKPKRAMRSMRMFNMFMLNVPFHVCKQLLDKNGTVLNDKFKLIIVTSDSVRSHPWKVGAVREEESDEENKDVDEEEQENWE